MKSIRGRQRRLATPFGHPSLGGECLLFGIPTHGCTLRGSVETFAHQVVPLIVVLLIDLVFDRRVLEQRVRLVGEDTT